jgi:hypothetical protein
MAVQDGFVYTTLAALTSGPLTDRGTVYAAPFSITSGPYQGTSGTAFSPPVALTNGEQGSYIGLTPLGLGVDAVYNRSGRSGRMQEVTINTPTIASVFMQSALDGQGQTGLAALLTIRQKKPGGSFSVITPTVTERGFGRYDIALLSAHLDTLAVSDFHITAPGAFPNDDLQVNVIAINKNDAVRAGLSALPSSAFGTPDGLPSAEQISNIGVTGAALNTTAASRVITTGTETGVLANASTLDAVFHTFTDVAGVIDFYYEFNLSATPNAAGVSAQWKGYLTSNNDSMKVFAWNWVSSTWDQTGVIPGADTVVVYGFDVLLTNAHTSAGLVRLRFTNTGLTTATFATDRILLGYAVTPSSATGIANQVWDSLRAGHQQAGTFGETLPNAAAGGVSGLPLLDVNLDVGANVRHWLGAAPSPAVAAAVLDALMSDHALVGSVADGVAIAAGLLQGNFFMDQTANTANGQTAARMRVFRTGTAAAAATAGGSGEGEFATFIVTTTYTGVNKIATHRVVRP